MDLRLTSGQRAYGAMALLVMIIASLNFALGQIPVGPLSAKQTWVLAIFHGILTSLYLMQVARNRRIGD